MSRVYSVQVAAKDKIMKTTKHFAPITVIAPDAAGAEVNAISAARSLIDNAPNRGDHSGEYEFYVTQIRYLGTPVN